MKPLMRSILAVTAGAQLIACSSEPKSQAIAEVYFSQLSGRWSGVVGLSEAVRVHNSVRSLDPSVELGTDLSGILIHYYSELPRIEKLKYLIFLGSGRRLDASGATFFRRLVRIYQDQHGQSSVLHDFENDEVLRQKMLRHTKGSEQVFLENVIHSAPELGTPSA